MARDYAKQRKPVTRRAKNTTTRKPTHRTNPTGRGWQLYLAGLFSGVFLSFLLYLGSLPPSAGTALHTGRAEADAAETTPPKPRFDFYTLLPEQTMAVEPEQVKTAVAHSAKPTEVFLLQAGAFKQREDAENRRAQLLLLNLEPKIEETNGDHGRWYRVTLGPFPSRSKLNKARSLTAAQNIDTLLLKRSST